MPVEQVPPHSVLQRLKIRYQNWRIARHPISDRMWFAALRSIPYAHRLPVAQRAKLRKLSALLLLEKRFSPAHELTITNAMRVRVAVKACVPVLELGLDYYSGFKEIVLYPDDFRVHEQRLDQAGVVHEEIRELCGQSLAQGPMVLSWGTIVAERAAQGQDLVIHECAHKLDTLNGEANGYPPPHIGMSTRDWTRAFRAAYDKLCDDLDAGRPTRLDPYAAEDPAEFFAVVSETFFTRPDVVADDFPNVYVQLNAFYKQDPRTVLKRRAER